MDIDVRQAYRVIERHRFEGVGESELKYIYESSKKAYVKKRADRIERESGFKIGEIIQIFGCSEIGRGTITRLFEKKIGICANVVQVLNNDRSYTFDILTSELSKVKNEDINNGREGSIRPSLF